MEMTTYDFLQLLLRHGEASLFVWILAEQAGLPIPTFPLLLAAGSLASVGRMNLVWSVGLAWAACLLADSIWYLIGRRHGPKVLRLLCRISFAPDSSANCIKAAWGVRPAHGEVRPWAQFCSPTFGGDLRSEPITLSDNRQLRFRSLGR